MPVLDDPPSGTPSGARVETDAGDVDVLDIGAIAVSADSGIVEVDGAGVSDGIADDSGPIILDQLNER